MSLYTTHHIQNEAPRQQREEPPVITGILRFVGVVFLVLAAIAVAEASGEEKTARILLWIACANSIIAAVGSFAVAVVIELLWKILHKPAPTTSPGHSPSSTQEEASMRAHEEEIKRRIASIEATVTDPAERQRLKRRVISEYS